VLASSVGIGFFVRNIWMVWMSMKSSMFGKSRRPYVSKARMEWNASLLPASAKVKACW
jgi:hypothetical protein